MSSSSGSTTSSRPGADRHRHQACAVVQSFDAGLSHAPEPADPDHGAAEMVRAPGRAGPDRRRSHRSRIGDAVLLRQRDTAPRHLCPAVPAGRASGHLRRVSRIHEGWRLRQAAVLAVGRLERGRSTGMAGTPLLAQTARGMDDLYPGRGKAGDNRNPSAMSAFTRPRPTPPGPASACPRKPSGSCSAAPRWPTATCRNAARFTP